MSDDTIVSISQDPGHSKLNENFFDMPLTSVKSGNSDMISPALSGRSVLPPNQLIILMRNELRRVA